MLVISNIILFAYLEIALIVEETRFKAIPQTIIKIISISNFSTNHNIKCIKETTSVHNKYQNYVTFIDPTASDITWWFLKIIISILIA